MWILVCQDVASVPRVDATMEMNCLLGGPSICSDLSTNHGNYGSWNLCDIITPCCVDVCNVTGLSVAWQLGMTDC